MLGERLKAHPSGEPLSSNQGHGPLRQKIEIFTFPWERLKDASKAPVHPGLKVGNGIIGHVERKIAVDEARAPRQGIQSVETGMQILDVMAKAGRPLSLSEVSKLAEMPPSKAHRYLVSFGRAGMTQQDSGTSLYDLGPAMRRIGAEALRRTNEVQSASNHAIELRDRTGHSVNVFVWGDAGPTLVNWAYGAHTISITVRIGASLPLLSSSAGLIYLSTLPESMVKKLVKAEIAADPLARQRWERFPETREEIFRKGYAMVSDSVLPGVSSMSAAAFAATDPIPLVLSVVAPKPQVREDTQDDLGAALIETTRRLSQELGGDSGRMMPTGSSESRK